MKELYLITGASGHLGNMLLKKLLNNENIDIRVLKLENDNTKFDDRVEVFCGDISDKNSLYDFFEFMKLKYQKIYLIHCASMVSIQSRMSETLEKINVKGTQNVLELAFEKNVDKVIYVSSVHAIKEQKDGKITKEVSEFSDDVVGPYAKTKAKASQIALDFAKKGLDISIVHPSGIIGEGDINNANNSNNLIRRAAKSSIFAYTKGGYNFVGIDDVVDGILSCLKKGVKGHCYILSGEYIRIRDILKIVKKYNKKLKLIYIPLPLAKLGAYFSEKISYTTKKKPLFTTYSLYTINSNSNFSYDKAKIELGYQPKDIREVIENYIISNMPEYNSEE